MRRYKYGLEPGSRKHICPDCGRKTLVRFIDNDTKHYLAENIGRCDREVKCGYFQKPQGQEANNTLLRALPPEPKVYLDLDAYRGWTCNNQYFYQPADGYIGYLSRYIIRATYDYLSLPTYLKDEAYNQVLNVMEKYDVRPYQETRKGQNYNITFPLIDALGRLHFVQLKEFDKQGHTIKGTTTAFHKVIPNITPAGYDTQYRKMTALFGEHLLSKEGSQNKTIVVVEAPKTALLLDHIYRIKAHEKGKADHGYIFMACMSVGQFNGQRLRPLINHKILGIPDYDTEGRCLTRWLNTESRMRAKGYDITILPIEGEPVNDGWDIADFIAYKGAEYIIPIDDL